MTIDLQAEWDSLFENPLAAGIGTEIIDHYAQPGRHYHAVSHLEQLFADQQRLFPDADRALKLTLFLHDVIYAPGSGYNEYDSMVYSDCALPELGVEWEEHQAIGYAIMATQKHDATTPLQMVVCDLDLLGLGSDPATYLRNRDLVRAEFGAFSEDEWKAGRRKFLEGMLARESVFFTSEVVELYEDQAQANLKAELEAL